MSTDNPYGSPIEPGWPAESGELARRLIIKRVGVLSLGKMFGAFYAVIGLFAGVFFALAILIAPPNDRIPAALGILWIVFMPPLYGIVGLIAGILVAALYNLIASLAGGVELDVEI
jgi:hypothetical protein